MNMIHTSSICLQKVMLENIKFDLRREYKFYATVPLGQRSKEALKSSISDNTSDINWRSEKMKKQAQEGICKKNSR